MNVRKLDTEEDFQAFVREMEMQRVVDANRLAPPTAYPAVLAYNIRTNDWDAKDFVDTAFVYADDFQQNGLSPNLNDNDR